MDSKQIKQLAPFADPFTGNYVGKTYLLSRYASTNKEFQFSPISTIGIDFKTKTVEIDDYQIKLQVWDTAGQERFHTITKSYFRGSQGILLVYDVTDRKSFDAVRKWMEQIQLHAEENIAKFLVGNKCEMERERVISKEEGEALAKEYGMPLLEASAMQNINVDESFMGLAKIAKDRILADYSTHSASGFAVSAQQKAATEGSTSSCAC